MTLQNLQAEFLDHLFSDEEHFNIFHPAHHLTIHRNNIFAQLSRALSDIYPLVLKLLGEDFFNMTARHYIKQYPSRSPNLNEYGEFFSDFLTEFPPVRNLVYLPEVANFEWACHQLFSAADHAPLNIQSLKNIHPEQYEHIRLILHPASQLFQAHFPLLRIIELCKGQINETINYHEGGVNLLLIRQEQGITLIELSEAEFYFLSLLEEGNSLACSLEKTLNLNPDFNLEEKLPEWVEKQIIVDYA